MYGFKESNPRGARSIIGVWMRTTDLVKRFGFAPNNRSSNNKKTKKKDRGKEKDLGRKAALRTVIKN